MAPGTGMRARAITGGALSEVNPARFRYKKADWVPRRGAWGTDPNLWTWAPWVRAASPNTGSLVTGRRGLGTQPSSRAYPALQGWDWEDRLYFWGLNPCAAGNQLGLKPPEKRLASTPGANASGKSRRRILGRNPCPAVEASGQPVARRGKGGNGLICYSAVLNPLLFCLFL